MRRAAFQGFGLLLALTATANAADEWQSVAAVGEVTVRIHWVSPAELLAAASKVGRRPDGQPQGFSVLRKSTATGAFFCDIYLPRRPTRLNDEATASLGHEMAHCAGFAHGRRKRQQTPDEPVHDSAPEPAVLANN
jgi:hypothetical protein